MATQSKDRYIEAVGRRKTAIARVRITPAGKTTYTVNEQKLEDYFPVEELRGVIQNPLKTLKETGSFAVEARVRGGGVAAQAGAILHGIARALVKRDETLRRAVKQEGWLTRDARVKERKKFGLRKARRAPQWSKR